MAEIKCPNCGKTFQIDESEYSKIVNQVKNAEFDKELEEHLRMHDKEKDLEIETLKQEISGTREKLTLEAEKTLQEEIASREARIKALEAEKKASEEQAKRNLEEQISLAVKNKEVEIQGLKQQLSTTEERVRMEEEEKARSLKQTIDAKNNEIEGLKSKAVIDKQQAEFDFKKRIDEATGKKDEEIARLSIELENEKNFKRSQSVKMIGESLEQYCATEFEKNRAIGFRNASFIKDNEVKEGSKGDFIFRDYDDDHTEIISIMFDMKNENDISATKHKNTDFLKELDKDRNLKNCEYAVLVSMLEPDNDLYNNGIVDVSYIYPKMYVIRPQFFIPMITLLRNAALNSLSDKKALIAQQNENIDLTHFEEDFNDFKKSFWNTYNMAKNRHDDAVNQIDNAIEHLKKIRDLLTTSNTHLEAAANKVDQISIKKLTKRAPSIEQKLNSFKNDK